MKYILLAGGLMAAFSVNAQHTLSKLWQTDTVLAIPESVKLDPNSQILYVSLIDGDGSAKDGKGGVAKLGTGGTIINADWVTGLNAPKGLGIYGDLLYVADITEVVVIRISEGKVVKKIPVDGAVFLNDITIDKNGVVYVSDSRKNTVHQIIRDQPVLFADDLPNANGVLAVGTDVYVLASGDLWKFDNKKQKTKIAGGMEKSTDGIEMVAPNEFIVSCWAGVIYYVKDGQAEQMLDTRAEKSNTADIGYDSQNHIVYVPTFMKKSVAAYQLK
jgi:hypothetical protein